MPPWINKFYVLDLTPEKSFIKWCVDQGITVFLHFLGQPGRPAREKKLGGLHARRPARRARRHQGRDRRRPGPRHRLLRRRHAARGHAGLHGGASNDQRIASATFFAARSISPMRAISRSSSTRSRSRRWKSAWPSAAISKAKSMATAFNLLRSNDLIWPYVVNNYFRGKEPFPFDLLYWNSDATRMPAANHSYLSAQLLSRQQPDQGRDGRSAATQDRSQSDQDADLQSRHPRGPHRAGEIGAARLDNTSAAR